MEKGQTIIFTCGKDNRSKWNRRKKTHLLCHIKILNRLQYEVHPSAPIRYTYIMFMWVLKCVNSTAVCTKVFHLWICQANVVSMLVLVVLFYFLLYFLVEVTKYLIPVFFLWPMHVAKYLLSQTRGPDSIVPTYWQYVLAAVFVKWWRLHLGGWHHLFSLLLDSLGVMKQ